MYHQLKTNHGMTLVEIALTLVVLGIALAVAVPNFNGSMQRAQEDRIPAELEADVRMALSAAKSQGRTLRIVFQDDGYVIRDLADSTLVLRSRSFGAHARFQGSGDPLVFPWGIIQQTTVDVECAGGTYHNLTLLPTGRLENAYGN
jgi:prepilin-type N-terminal cleavage/methylation domain-containing protein